MVIDVGMAAKPPNFRESVSPHRVKLRITIRAESFDSRNPEARRSITGLAESAAVPSLRLRPVPC
jgi:hypothetical protein